MGKKDRAKERRAKKLAKAAAEQRLRDDLARANAAENPLAGLEPFLSFDVTPRRRREEEEGSAPALPWGCSPTSVANPGDGDGDPGGNKPSSAATISSRVSSSPSPLPPDLHDACLGLFEANMGDLYRASSWGLDLAEKSAELRHEAARFLTVTATEEGGGGGGGSFAGDRGRGVLAFAHYRFEADDLTDPAEGVLYVYEIQVSEGAQGCGLGRRLMSVLELIARGQGMRRVMLTVFRSNGGAMRFYRDRMGYSIDPSSPSNFGEGADYEILSKAVVASKQDGAR